MKKLLKSIRLWWRRTFQRKHMDVYEGIEVHPQERLQRLRSQLETLEQWHAEGYRVTVFFVYEHKPKPPCPYCPHWHEPEPNTERIEADRIISEILKKADKIDYPYLTA